jgi:hypothetical protein
MGWVREKRKAEMLKAEKLKEETAINQPGGR